MKKPYALETHYFPLGAEVLLNTTYYLFLGIWSLVKDDDKIPDPRRLEIMADMSAPPPPPFFYTSSRRRYFYVGECVGGNSSNCERRRRILHTR